MPEAGDAGSMDDHLQQAQQEQLKSGEAPPVSIPLPASAEEDVEAKLGRIDEMLRLARTMPLSSSVLVAREEVLALIADIKETLPKELRQARWMLREKDEFIAKARREADLILEDAHAEAARMVSETEVARDAEWKANLIIEEAENRARNLRAETDGYIDSKLASFESILRRTLEAIVAGRERLRAVPDLEQDYAPQTGWPQVAGPVEQSAAGGLTAVEGSPDVAVIPAEASGGNSADAVFDQDRI